ncbi:hypothetical protein [Pseudactinotalea sp.]|uniref:hypothetical protein n=1 Tax=Pseudactinotalea sp. TaxID=1926260 RepID=UPI003B3B36CE
MGGDLPNTYGYSELIHPSKFPIKTADLHMGNIDDAADALEAMGTALVNNVTSASESWDGLPNHYEAPEATEFYDLLDQPLANAESFNSRMISAAGHLRDWADVVGRERPNLTTLEEDAQSFYDEVVGGVETLESTTVATPAGVYTHTMTVTKDWDEVTDTWDRNTALWERYMALHSLFQEADVTAADLILALREVDTRLPGQPGGPEVESTGVAPEMPWGDVVRGGQAEMILGQIFLEQFGPLFGYNAFTGEFDGELAREAWTGVWNGIVDLVSIRPDEIALFAAQQFVARWTGTTVEYDPDNRAHRVIGGFAEGLTIDLFSDDPLSQWEEDPQAATATLHFLGIGMLVSAPLGAGASAVLGPLARTLLRRGSVIVGNVRFWVDSHGISMTNLLDGTWVRLAGFGPDGEAAMRTFMHLYEQEHGPFDTTPGSGTPGPGSTPRFFEPQPGTQVVLPDGDVPPHVVSQSDAPSRWTSADVEGAWENAYRNADGVRVDPRTGAPLVGGPPTQGVTRQWVMYWDDANNRWVAGNRGDGWGATPRPIPADTFDPGNGSRYASGDPHLPGDHPPGRVPPATTQHGSGDTGIVHLNRGDRGMDYQLQISGYSRTPDGRIPEYQYVDPETGESVDFDGHTTRGRPPQEVFLDGKDGYEVLGRAPEIPMSQGMRTNLLAEADRQLRVLPEDAVLEWHVSDPVGASAIRKLLADNGITADDITVIYTPKR